MWSRFCYSNKVEELFIPTPNKGWSWLKKNEHMPILVISDDISTIFTEKITRNVCNTVKVISKRKIEPLCSYCQNSLNCILNGKATDFNSYDRDFLPFEDKKLKWSKAKLEKLRNTIEIPFNLLFEDPMLPLHTSRFELLTSDEVKKLKFDVERLRANITKLNEIGDSKRLMNFTSLEVYTRSGNEDYVWDELPLIFHNKLNSIIELCNDFLLQTFEVEKSNCNL